MNYLAIKLIVVIILAVLAAGYMAHNAPKFHSRTDRAVCWIACGLMMLSGGACLTALLTL